MRIGFTRGAAATTVDLDKSFYVGDAAGRQACKPHLTKKDFADSDYTMAINVGCPFFTPEAFFLDSKQAVHVKLPVPQHCLSTQIPTRATAASAVATDAENKSTGAGGTQGRDSYACGPEIRLLFGPPASGKSSACARRFPHHVRINQDTLGSLDKCLSSARHALKMDDSGGGAAAGGEVRAGVVVDNTNLDESTRAKWRDLGKEMQVPVRVSVVEGISEELSCHLAVLRVLTPNLENRILNEWVIKNLYTKYRVNKMLLSKEFGDDCVSTLTFAVEKGMGSSLQQRLLYSFLPNLQKTHH